MIIDSYCEFSDAQAVTVSAVGQHIIDNLTARGMFVGSKKVYCVVQVDVAMTDAGSNSTITPTIETSATASAAAPGGVLNGTVVTMQTLPIIPATSAAGAFVVAELSPASYLRHIGIRFTTTNGDLTTGTFSAFICSETDLQGFYPVGYAIS